MPWSVFLWCPAYTLPGKRLASTLQAAREFCTAIGGDLAPAPDLGLDAGIGAWPPISARSATFRQALRHDVLLAARGGYGCLDLLAALRGHGGPLPWLIGYSDLTVLHAAWAVLGAPESLYGFMPGVPHGDRALASVIAHWHGERQELDAQACPEVQPLRAGQAQGRLFAGCLRVLVGLVGTPWMPSLHGRILALEDIDERPYRLDRDLQQLHLAGCLEGVAGLVTNAFPADLPPGYQGPTAQQIISTWADRLHIPAIMSLPFGHHPDPLTLPCGRPATLTVTSDTWHLDIAAR